MCPACPPGPDEQCRQRGPRAGRAASAPPRRCGVRCSGGTKQRCSWGEGTEAEASPYRINLYCLARVGTRVNAGVETVMEG